MPLGTSTLLARATVDSSSSCTAVLPAWRRFETSSRSSAARAARIPSGKVSPLRRPPAAPPTAPVASNAASAPGGGSGGGAGGACSDAAVPAPGSRLRTPTATRISGQNPWRCVWYTVPENAANPALWFPAPYSRSNSVAARSIMTPSAAAVPGRSSMPVNWFSHMSTGAEIRAPAPIAMSSLIAETIIRPPVQVSVRAPPSRMLSSPLIQLPFQPPAVIDIRPCTVVSDFAATIRDPRPIRSISRPSTSVCSSPATLSMKLLPLPVRK